MECTLWDMKNHMKIDIRNPRFVINLQSTPLVDILVTKDLILALRLSTLELYALPDLSTSASVPNMVINPIYVYKFPWRVDNGVMTIRQRPGTRRFNDICVVLRKSLMQAINLLHHYEIRPNRFFLNDGPINTGNLPYQFPPVLQETIASPVRLHAVSDLAVGPYGTILWTDSHTEDYFNHADRGQRLAGRFSGFVEGDNDEIELSDQIATTRAESVYAYQEEDSWVRIALDERDGKIALGRDDGKISVLEFI